MDLIPAWRKLLIFWVLNREIASFSPLTLLISPFLKKRRKELKVCKVYITYKLSCFPPSLLKLVVECQQI